MFEPSAAVRAFCRAPTLPREDCAICREIPEACYRDHDHDGDTAPDAVNRLGILAEGPTWTALERCDECRRLYHSRYETESLVGSTHNVTYYERADFQTVRWAEWGLPESAIVAMHTDVFRHHAIVRFRASPSWFSLDEIDQLVELTPETYRTMIQSDPPLEIERARFATLVCEIEDPNARVISEFNDIRWNQGLTAALRLQIRAVYDASRVEPPAISGDAVRLWLVSKQRLICRFLTIAPGGDYVCEDAVIAESLPIS